MAGSAPPEEDKPKKRRSWAQDDPRLERVAEKRAKILDSARVVFLSEGYAAATLEKISSHSGISKMTIYRHFDGKESLFVETINQQCEAIYRFAEQEPASSLEQAEAELRRFGATFIEIVTARDNLNLHQMLMGEMVRFPHLGRMFFDVVISHSIGAIERILSGLFPRKEVAWRAPAFMHLVMGDGYQRLSLGKLTEAECRRQCALQTKRAAKLILRSDD